MTEELLDYVSAVASKGINVSKQAEKDVLNALKYGKLNFIVYKDSDGNTGAAFVESTLQNLYDKQSKDLYSYINTVLVNTDVFSRGLESAVSAFLDEHHLGGAAFMLDAKFAHAMTVHKSQGSQFDNVIYVTSSRDQWIQSKDLGNSKYKQSPAYVAVTRAKKKVTVIYIK